MLPQLNTIWFGNQIFWFCIIFGSFSLFSFKVVVPYILKIQNYRKEVINRFINDANINTQKAKEVAAILVEKKKQMQAESAQAMLKARKAIEDYNFGSGQKAVEAIEKYRSTKALELKEILKSRKNDFVINCGLFANKIALYAGIKNFVINKDQIKEIEHNLSI